jgi:WD40 repeat protein
MFYKAGEIAEHSAAVYDISLDAPFLYSASADGFVARWNLDTLTQDNFAIKCTNTPYSLTFDKDQRNLWFGLSNGDLHVVAVDSKTELKFFKQHRTGIFSLCSIPQKKIVIAGDADGNLSIWHAEKLELLLFLPLNCGKTRKIRANSDGTLFSIQSLDDKIRIFETNGFNEISTLAGHKEGACCAFFSPKNETEILISGGKDGHLKKWDWPTEKLLQAIPAHNFAVYDFTLLDHGKLFATASRDKTIKIWETESFNFVQKLEAKTGGHKHSVNALLTLDEHRFISCSDDRKIILWSNFPT